jgi:hypothetical protein
MDLLPFQLIVQKGRSLVKEKPKDMGELRPLPFSEPIPDEDERMKAERLEKFNLGKRERNTRFHQKRLLAFIKREGSGKDEISSQEQQGGEEEPLSEDEAEKIIGVDRMKVDLGELETVNTPDHLCTAHLPLCRGLLLYCTSIEATKEVLFTCKKKFELPTTYLKTTLNRDEETRMQNS